MKQSIWYALESQAWQLVLDQARPLVNRVWRETFQAVGEPDLQIHVALHVKEVELI